MTIGEALALRSWALSVLASGRPTAPPAAGDTAWWVFLQSERCAGRLRERLGAAGAGLPLLADAAAQEAQRVLLARRELQAVASVALAEKLRVVVLKGGVPVADGSGTLDLDDLDVLADAQDAHALAAGLERRGYAAQGYRSAHSLRSRVGLGGLPVEIHLSLLHQGEKPSPDLWGGVRPLRGIEGLWALAPADHLWHVLFHAVVLHPERRGRLRDVLLVSDTLTRCTEVERAGVERRAAQKPLTGALSATLKLAAALRDGDPAAEDPFVDTAAARLAMVEFFRRRRLPAVIEPAVGLRLMGRLFEPRPPVPLGLLEESGLRHVAWLERRVPAVGRVWRRVLQLGQSVIAAAVALPLAAMLQRRARAALRSGHR